MSAPPRPAAGRGGTLLLLAALALAGCNKRAAVTTAPSAAPPPPVIGAVSPAPRSTFTAYDADIWAEFNVDLNPLSVNTRDVYLKLDTVRLPITVRWEAATRRIHVQPLVTLALLTTYTVELSPNLVTIQGVPLGSAYRWQFTTTSVRRSSSPFPADRAVESPFTTMSWGGNETTPGSLTYEVYAGQDSVAVAARTDPFVYRGTRTLFLPKVRWHEHGPTFWSVTVDNATAKERSNGAVWRFDTPGADAPIDSVLVPCNIFGYRRFNSTQGACTPAELLAGGGYFCGLVWSTNLQPQTLRLADVRMDLTATPLYADSLPGDVSAWLTIAGMGCGFSVLTSFLTDEVNGHLATGALIGPRTVRFHTDTLLTHLQAAIRLRSYFGYLFRARQAIHFESPLGVEPAAAPVLMLYYFTGNGTLSRAGPAAAPASAPGQSSRARPAAAPFPLDPRGVQSVNSR